MSLMRDKDPHLHVRNSISGLSWKMKTNNIKNSLEFLASEKTIFTFYKDCGNFHTGCQAVIKDFMIDNDNNLIIGMYKHRRNHLDPHYDLRSSISIKLDDLSYLPFFMRDRSLHKCKIFYVYGCWSEDPFRSRKMIDNSYMLGFWEGFSRKSLTAFEKAPELLPDDYLLHLWELAFTPPRQSLIQLKFAEYSISIKKRLPTKIEDEILNDYCCCGYYSLNHGIELTQEQLENFLNKEAISYAAKYALDLLKKQKKVPELLHNYLFSLKLFDDSNSVHDHDFYVNNYLQESGVRI